MKTFFLTVISLVSCTMLAFSPVAAKSENCNSCSGGNQNGSQSQNKVQAQDRDGDCDGDGTINSEDTDMDESINACKQYQNRNRWESDYNPRSENARQHMSIVAQAVEGLLAAADRMEDPGIGDQVREIAQQHGQTAEGLIENEDKLNQRSGVLKFFIGSDYTVLDNVKQQIEQFRNQVRELNQIRTQLQNAKDQQELQNQINILELQLANFQTIADQEEQVFSLFGWLAKLLS